MSTPTGGYPHDHELRARIQAFSPDEPGAIFPFSARLARENGWTRAFAERVVDEYRRFLYLAMTAGHMVSPSDEVDEAWHLHLTYTRSYWDELCASVLRRPLHHEPTRGGRAEGEKFVDLYARTLDSYRAAFGHPPPSDIWPSPRERLARKAHVPPVSRATHWIIRKPRVPRGVATAAAGLAAMVLVAACASTGAGDTVPGMVGFGIVLSVVAVLGALFVRPRRASTELVRRRVTARSRAGASPAVFFGGLAGTEGGGGGGGGSDCGDGGGAACDGGGGGCGGGGCGGGGCGGGG